MKTLLNYHLSKFIQNFFIHKTFTYPLNKTLWHCLTNQSVEFPFYYLRWAFLVSLWLNISQIPFQTIRIMKKSIYNNAWNRMQMGMLWWLEIYCFRTQKELLQHLPFFFFKKKQLWNDRNGSSTKIPWILISQKERFSSCEIMDSKLSYFKTRKSFFLLLYFPLLYVGYVMWGVWNGWNVGAV